MQPVISIANVKFSVPLESARHWTADSRWIYEEKKDGVRAILQNHILSGRNRIYPCNGDVPESLMDCCFDGELCGETYWVFDLLNAHGEDIRHLPLRDRRNRLQSIAPLFPSWMRLIPCAANGGEFLEAVLRDGGEGVVAKDLNLPYGQGWYKCKQVETFDCVILERHAYPQSLSLGQYIDGQLIPCGKVACTGSELWQGATPGQVVEIACHSRNRSGKFREPRILRLRSDKPATECLA